MVVRLKMQWTIKMVVKLKIQLIINQRHQQEEHSKENCLKNKEGRKRIKRMTKTKKVKLRERKYTKQNVIMTSTPTKEVSGMYVKQVLSNQKMYGAKPEKITNAGR